jgi:hypothetical protein
MEKIIKEVSFVENHAELSEYRGINVLAFLILIQEIGGSTMRKGKYYNCCMTVGMDEYPDVYLMGKKSKSSLDRSKIVSTS